MPTSTTFDFFSTNHDTLNMEEGQTPQFHVDVGQSTNVIGRDDRGHYVNQQGRISHNMRSSSTQEKVYVHMNIVSSFNVLFISMIG